MITWDRNWVSSIVPILCSTVFRLAPTSLALIFSLLSLGRIFWAKEDKSATCHENDSSSYLSKLSNRWKWWILSVMLKCVSHSLQVIFPRLLRVRIGSVSCLRRLRNVPGLLCLAVVRGRLSVLLVTRGWIASLRILNRWLELVPAEHVSSSRFLNQTALHLLFSGHLILFRSFLRRKIMLGPLLYTWKRALRAIVTSVNFFCKHRQLLWGFKLSDN